MGDSDTDAVHVASVDTDAVHVAQGRENGPEDVLDDSERPRVQAQLCREREREIERCLVLWVQAQLCHEGGG